MIVCRRRVVRCTTEIHHTGKPFVVRLDAGGKTISVKIKGKRTWFIVPVKQLYAMGGWNAAAVLKAKRKAEKAERKRLREM